MGDEREGFHGGDAGRTGDPRPSGDGNRSRSGVSAHRPGAARRARWRNGRRPESEPEIERAMRDPRMCVPCDRCGEHLLIAEGHYSTDDRKDDAQHRARLRAAIEIGTRKLRCLRCSGRYPKNEKTIALLSGPMRPIEYRLNERKSR